MNAQVPIAESCNDGSEQLLSGREIECVRLLAKGLPDREIGTRLEISIRTVRFHVSNIKRVLKVRTRAHIVIKALRDDMLREQAAGVPGDSEQAKMYRRRATEARAIALEMRNRDRQRMMSKVAENYENIADALNQLEHTKRSLAFLLPDPEGAANGG